MVENESAVVVPRAPFWLIHTHRIGPDCPPKAVKGWKAVRACEALRSLPNVAIVREAEPFCLLGVAVPCVCFLDDKHIDAELRLVDYDASDEIPASAADIRVLLSRLQLRMTGGGRCASAQDTLDDKPKSGWHSVKHNFVEASLISSIERDKLCMTMQILREELWSCRKSYYSFHTAPAVDPFPHAFVDPLAQKEVRTHQRKVRLPKAPGEILTSDVKGRPVEFALYSKRRILKKGQSWISELESWAPKPKPIGLLFSSISDPDFYTWQEPPKSKSKRVRHWSKGDGHIPYGPVAVLKAEVLARLNAQRKRAFRVENI